METLQCERPTNRPTNRPTTGDEEPLHHLLLFVVAAVASAVVPFAVAAATTGAVNAVTWLAFCLAAAGAVMGGVACFLRFGSWAFERARRRTLRSD